MNQRIRNHAALSAFTAGSLGIAVIIGPAGSAADQLSIVSAYLCMLLLAAALLIGPASALRSGRPVANSYLRRDTGIWAAMNGLLHFYLANVLSMTYEYLGIYVDNPALPPSAALRSSLYTWGTIFGYVIAVLFIVLLILSSDRMLHKVGLKWWKRIQRTSYLCFALTSLHAFAFQVLETRAWLWIAIVALLTLATVAGQSMGLLAVRNRGVQRQTSEPAGAAVTAVAHSKWNDLTAEDARSRKLYGFGGWLIVFYALAALLLVWQLFGALSPGDGLIKMFGNKDNAAIMRVVLIIKGLSWLPFLILVPLRKPMMPTLTLVCIAATFLLEGVVVNFFLGLPASKLAGVNIFNIVIACGFSAYLVYSKRVNITYRLRVAV